MSFIGSLIARFKKDVAPKPRQSVLTFDKYEQMTATQALRFNELQGAFDELAKDGPAVLPDQPWYSLQDACRRLEVTPAAILRRAAENQLHCFVYAQNATGYWDAAASTPVPGSVPDFLVLPAESCRAVTDEDGATTKMLEYHYGAQVLRYRLTEPTWVNADVLYLQHPLPDPQALTG